jgi:hypothetical protein
VYAPLVLATIVFVVVGAHIAAPQDTHQPAPVARDARLHDVKLPIIDRSSLLYLFMRCLEDGPDEGRIVLKRHRLNLKLGKKEEILRLSTVKVGYRGYRVEK